MWEFSSLTSLLIAQGVRCKWPKGNLYFTYKYMYNMEHDL